MEAIHTPHSYAFRRCHTLLYLLHLSLRNAHVTAIWIASVVSITSLGRADEPSPGALVFRVTFDFAARG
jgi:hypothetical protein